MKIYLFLLAALFISCNSAEEEIGEIFVKDGKIYKEGEAATYTGIVTDTVNKNIIQYQVKDGVKNGFIKIYSMDKTVLLNGEILDNKNVGSWEYYYTDGSLESRGKFTDDLPDGKWEWFYNSGKLKEAGYFEQYSGL